MMHSLSDDDDDDNDDDDDDDIMMILSNNIAQKALTVNPGRLSSFIIWRSIFTYVESDDHCCVIYPPATKLNK
jgi:hypothetical protein